MLRKFNFPGFHQSQRVHRHRRYLNAKLANLTPLGISQPLRPKDESSKEIITSFEETIKKGTSPVKLPSEYHFSDSYRESDRKVKQEESVCGLDDTDPFRSPSHSTSRPGSHSPPKVSSKGEEKENQKPANNYKLINVGQYDIRGTPLGTSQLAKMASFILPQPSDTATPPIDHEPDSNFQGPDISLLGDRTVSTISLPSTEGPPSPKPFRHTKSNHKLYRKSLFESDADDEASDKETHHGSDEEPVDDFAQPRHEVVEDVTELRSAMDKIQLGKRSRDGDDDGGRTEIDRSALGLRSALPAEQLMVAMKHPREVERERVGAETFGAQVQSMKDKENAAPAKRRKGSEGQLVGMVGLPLEARTEEG